MNQTTKDFEFKRFTIIGGKSGMPVSTDGVLLGAWADIKMVGSILDIGTGTGLLALMSAQRNPNADILAIDIDADAIEAARHNAASCPWSSRIQVSMTDVTKMPIKDQFERIICNPPYFNSGEQSQREQRAKARHTDTLAHKDLLKACADLLSLEGSASFILPKVEGDGFIQLAKTSGWHLSRLCEIKTTAKKPISRYLIELRRVQVEMQTTSLQIHQGTEYSQDFIALTRDFYLKM
ncbi:tRNA1(Val) (adenine(37)-N6)-methyltransferase [Vibrio ishigakensis]|nr:methyltransferase [Vibrio ishigakensis]